MSGDCVIIENSEVVRLTKKLEQCRAFCEKLREEIQRLQELQSAIKKSTKGVKGEGAKGTSGKESKTE